MQTVISTETRANHGGPKHRPRLERDRATRVVLLPRDYEIFTIFLTVRVVSARDLYALAGSQFESPFVFWRRLNRLYHAGYLMRPPEQRWRLRQKPGNTELLYMLGNRGAEELKRGGLLLPKIDWDQKAIDFKPYSFDHPLLITRFLTAFSLGVQKTPGLEILELYPEGKFHDNVTFFDGKETVTLPIKPDATFVVEDTRNDRTERLGIFYEAQRRTMPLQRSSFKLSSFYKKLVAYLHYWQQRDRFQDQLAAEDFIVLTVSEDEAAAVILRDFAQEADQEKQGTNLFWFAPSSTLSLEQPERVLLNEVWTTAAGERGSLF